MLETKATVLEQLQLDDIQEVLRRPGPCITVLLPPYRPGEQAKSMAGLIKSDIQTASRKLSGLKISRGEIEDLLDPLEQLTGDQVFLGGAHWGCAIFRSPQVFRKVDLLNPTAMGLKVGARFEIRPLLAMLNSPSEFYVLRLTKKRVELIRCQGFHAEKVTLPKGTPATLDEALAFRPPDHDLENRSAAGSAPSAMRRVRFGTGSGRETQQTYLADFYKAVDRGMRTLLHGLSPVILSGVDEDTALYRNSSKYSNLLAQPISGAPEALLSDNDLLNKAYEIVRAESISQAAHAASEAREEVVPARFSTNLSEILRAAAEGRVMRLYLDEAAEALGEFDGGREEDLLNAAAVETIVHGGNAFALPGASMPDHASIAAVFRY